MITRRLTQGAMRSFQRSHPLVRYGLTAASAGAAATAALSTYLLSEQAGHVGLLALLKAFPSYFMFACPGVTALCMGVAALVYVRNYPHCPLSQLVRLTWKVARTLILMMCLMLGVGAAINHRRRF